MLLESKVFKLDVAYLSASPVPRLALPRTIITGTVWKLQYDMRNALEGHMRLARETPTFIYGDSLDMTGFQDGTCVLLHVPACVQAPACMRDSVYMSRAAHCDDTTACAGGTDGAVLNIRISTDAIRILYRPPVFLSFFILSTPATPTLLPYIYIYIYIISWVFGNLQLVAN